MNRFIILTLLVLPFVSCRKSWLEVTPFGELIATTTSDYDQLMNNASLYYFAAGGWGEAIEMGDEVSGEGPYVNTTNSVEIPRAFQYQAVIYQQTDPEPQDLTFAFSNLYLVNKIITQVAGSTGGTAAQIAQLKAEGQFTRAWIYFNLANYYIKPYAAATAGTDPGFPIIDQAVATTSNYTRGTVQDVYDFMVSDLTAAIPNLPLVASEPTRISRPAAEGFLGKVYLFMGKYAAADSQFTAALSDIATAGTPKLYNYNVTLGTGGAWLPISTSTGPESPLNNFTDETESVVFKAFYNSSFNGNQFGNNGLVLAPWVQQLFDPADWRLKFYSATYTNGSANPAGRLRKYGQTYTRFGLELPDLYLMSAEAKARMGDLADANTLLGTLRQNRLPAANAPVPTDTLASQTAMIHFIIDERIREFATEGYRWFDMRRLSVDPLFSGISFVHTVFNDDATNSTTTYPLSQPNRLTLQLPPTIMNANPNMMNNP
jgi:hypothetical protein